MTWRAVLASLLLPASASASPSPPPSPSQRAHSGFRSPSQLGAEGGHTPRTAKAAESCHFSCLLQAFRRVLPLQRHVDLFRAMGASARRRGEGEGQRGAHGSKTSRDAPAVYTHTHTHITHHTQYQLAHARMHVHAVHSYPCEYACGRDPAAPQSTALRAAGPTGRARCASAHGIRAGEYASTQAHTLTCCSSARGLKVWSSPSSPPSRCVSVSSSQCTHTHARHARRRARRNVNSPVGVHVVDFALSLCVQARRFVTARTDLSNAHTPCPSSCSSPAVRLERNDKSTLEPGSPAHIENGE